MNNPTSTLEHITLHTRAATRTALRRIAAIALMTLLLSAGLSAVLSAQDVAQADVPEVAYVNSSGQLIIASSDGATRWILTNPGEQVNSAISYDWSPSHQRLLFAVGSGAATEFRIADLGGQSITSLGLIEAASGAVWLDDNQVRIVSAGDAAVPSGVSLANGRWMADNGRDIVLRRDRQLVLATSQQETALPLAGDDTTVVEASWNGSGQHLAVSGLNDGNQPTLLVIDLSSGASWQASSAYGAPVLPLLWLNDDQLLYRDDSGQVRLFDTACADAGQCASPFDSAPVLLPASADEVTSAGGFLYYSDNTVLKHAPLSCIGTGDCVFQSTSIASLLPRTPIDVRGDRLAFTRVADGSGAIASASAVIADASCADLCVLFDAGLNSVAGPMTDDGSALIFYRVGEGLILQASGNQPILLSPASTDSNPLPVLAQVR